MYLDRDLRIFHSPRPLKSRFVLCLATMKQPPTQPLSENRGFLRGCGCSPTVLLRSKWPWMIFSLFWWWWWAGSESAVEETVPVHVSLIILSAVPNVAALKWVQSKANISLLILFCDPLIADSLKRSFFTHPPAPVLSCRRMIIKPPQRESADQSGWLGDDRFSLQRSLMSCDEDVADLFSMHAAACCENGKLLQTPRQTESVPVFAPPTPIFYGQPVFFCGEKP